MLSNYTPEELAAMHKAFSAAKKYLDNGTPGESKTFFICLAISNAKAATDIASYEAKLATDHISACLGNEEFSVSAWIYHNVPEYRYLVGAVHKRQQIQVYRHRWLDHLIEETKPKEAYARPVI